LIWLLSLTSVSHCCANVPSPCNALPTFWL
jgi:hypothetical protein